MVLLEDHQTTGLARSGGAVAAAASNVGYWWKTGGHFILIDRIRMGAMEGRSQLPYCSNEPVTEANTKYHCCDQVLYHDSEGDIIISFIIHLMWLGAGYDDERTYCSLE
jgi:hypothetical protein